MCWKPEFIFLVFASTSVDYITALGMERSTTLFRRRIWLSFSLTFNLGMFFFFKYLNFLSGSLQEAFNAFNIVYHIPTLNILLPVGISFYMFQSLSYQSTYTRAL